MKSTIWITPVDNIKDYAVIDNSKVIERVHDYKMDVFDLFNIVHQEPRRSNLESVSLYDDVIIRDGVKYKILRMITK